PRRTTRPGRAHSRGERQDRILLPQGPGTIPNDCRYTPSVHSERERSPTAYCPPMSNPRDRSTPNVQPGKAPNQFEHYLDTRLAPTDRFAATTRNCPGLRSRLQWAVRTVRTRVWPRQHHVVHTTGRTRQVEGQAQCYRRAGLSHSELHYCPHSS